MAAFAETETLLGMFYHWERHKPDSVYLRQPIGQEWIEYSWSEVGRQARRIANALQSIDPEGQGRISILSKNCAHWVIADLAIMMSGRSSAPVFTTMTGGDVRYCLSHSGADILFVGLAENWGQVSSDVPDNVTVIAMPGADAPDVDFEWDQLLQEFEPLVGCPDRGHNDEITTIYTSGSTGLPKGVVYTFEGAGHIVKNLGQTFRMGENDRLISYLPLAHGFERAAIDFMSLYAGCTIGFNENLGTFAADMQVVRPTFFQCVPRLWSKFQESVLTGIGGQGALDKLLADPETAETTRMRIKQDLGLDKARILTTGSAPTPCPLHAWYEALDMPLCELYGQSEVLSGTSNLPWDRKPGTLGKPTANTEVRIADNGEIMIKALAVMDRYLHEPEKTAETLVDGWIHSGDKGHIDDDGFLAITGRVKEIFKTTKGKYVAPLPIESQFSSNPHLEQICLIGAGLPQTILLVQLSVQGQSVAPEALVLALRESTLEINSRLEGHAKIAVLIISSEDWSAENGLVTHTLKIKRAALERRYALQAEAALDGGATVDDPSIIWEEWTGSREVSPVSS